MKDANAIFGRKKQRKTIVANIWNKRSIYFDISYWCKLDVRHIYVMHVEKNVRDSLIEILLI